MSIAPSQYGLGIVLHTDRGEQYTSGDYVAELKSHIESHNYSKMYANLIEVGRDGQHNTQSSKTNHVMYPKSRTDEA